MTQHLEIILFVKPRTTSKISMPSRYYGHRELQYCQNRKKMIEWFYGAQEHYETGRSTLFLSIQLLDRLILKNFRMNNENKQLVATSIFLLSCKFNEVKRPTFRQINILLQKDENDSLEGFLQMEKDILEKLEYNIWEKENVYDKLCRLQDKFSCVPKEKVQTIIELALVNPQFFRYGHETLQKAVELKINQICTPISNTFNSQKTTQTEQIADELGQKIQEDPRTMIEVHRQ